MASKFLLKTFFPLRSNLISDSCNKSHFHTWFENALGKTRQLLRVFYNKESKLSPQITRSQHRLPLEFLQQSGPTLKPRFVYYRPGLLHNVTAKWISDSVAGAVTKEWQRKALRRGGGPLIGFVGFALAKKPSLLTKEEECEEVSYWIRDSLSTIPWCNIGLNIDKSHGINTQFSLADLKIGDMIAKGCNAAVYSAQFQDANKNEECMPSSVLTDITISAEVNKLGERLTDGEKDRLDKKNNLLSCKKLIIPHSEGDQGVNQFELNFEPKKDLQQTVGNLEPYNLAVKVMFNYSAESNAFAIWRAMHRETLPAIANFTLDEWEKHKTKKVKLKPHPNIVEMYFSFADQVPLLPGAHKNFPQALPIRLLSDGCGRNMTLFLVMKRYHCSLKDYLKIHQPSAQTSLLLFTQLLEAIVHLHESGVAHRDLKSDNILLDLTEGISLPKLAITDFGCCLENLYLNYPSYEISKGGNMALMAPEVANTEPGPLAVVDYSRSDLWTAGTLAYEIFGADNPFYSRKSSLKSNHYKSQDLPSLPKAAPASIQKLVKEMLHVDPKQRPSPNFAATVCQILLHTPPLLSKSPKKHLSKDVLDWMFTLFSKTYLEGSLQKKLKVSVHFQQRHAFCSRIQYLEVIKAIKYILDA